LFCGLLNVFKRVSKHKKSKPVDNYNKKFINTRSYLGVTQDKCASSSLHIINKKKEFNCEKKSNHPTSLIDSKVVELEPILKESN
jgi:hypothetical protein